MSKGYYSGTDVDTARIAEVLWDLADDIEEGGVLVTRSMTYTDVEPEEAVRLGLGMEFNVLMGSRTLGNLAHEYESRDEPRVIRE
jgi:hypothetical protein